LVNPFQQGLDGAKNHVNPKVQEWNIGHGNDNLSAQNHPLVQDPVKNFGNGNLAGARGNRGRLHLLDRLFEILAASHPLSFVVHNVPIAVENDLIDPQ